MLHNACRAAAGWMFATFSPAVSCAIWVNLAALVGMNRNWRWVGKSYEVPNIHENVTIKKLTWTACMCGDWMTEGCVAWMTPWTWTVWPEGNCTRVTAGDPLPALEAATETCKNYNHHV